VDDPTKDDATKPKDAKKAPFLELGVLIALGAGVGAAFGVLLGDIAIGIACGAGVGVVAGAVFESTRKRQ
jgi:uncharacterized membrane protein